MLKRFLLWLLLLIGILGWSQYFQYTSDLRWDEDLKCEVGFANPTKSPASVVLTGYTNTGGMLGTKSFDLPGLGRKSFSCQELFSTSSIAFLKLEASVELGSYVLYQSEHTMSTLPFSSTPGSKVFVPHIARDTELFYTETTVANFSSSRSALISQPYMDPANPDSLTPDRLTEPVYLPSELSQNAQSRFTYSSLYPELTPSLQWDIITSTQPQGLVGVEHFGKSLQQRASLSLNRSPFQEIIISHISHDKDHFWTGLVLVNTKDGIVPVTIQSYMEDGTPFQKVHFELQPFEKKTFLIGEGQELGLSDLASWMKITPYEQALIGYEIFGSPDRTFLAGMEAAMIPTNMVTLPFTPTNDDQWSGFGMINPTDHDICVQIGGLDDEGNILGYYDCKRMDPHSKFITTLEDFFGEKAKDIRWVRLNTERGTMSGFSLIGDRDRTKLAGLQGISTYNREGTVFSANFEHDGVDTLVDQGWQETQFADVWQWRWLNHFSIEPFYEAVNGVTHLQARKYPMEFYFWGYVDRIGFVSPFFEIPVEDNNLFLSFYLRLIDPIHTNDYSRYGIIWREEGSNSWHWHGVTGPYILRAMDEVYNFTVTQKWNLEVHEMTQWLPFEVQLPSSLAGKRIQLGLYYESPNEYLEPDQKTPYLWCDFIRVTTDPVIPPFLRIDDFHGSGSFYFDLP